MAPRILTPNSDGDILASDGTIVRLSAHGQRHRMRDVLRWAKANGFTSSRTYRSESPKRAWTLTGQGRYEGFTILCWNRSGKAQTADIFQHRSYAIFYKGAPLLCYFDPQGATVDKHFQRITDLLLDDAMPFLLRHATYSDRRAYAPSPKGFAPIMLSRGLAPTLDAAA